MEIKQSNSGFFIEQENTLVAQLIFSKIGDSAIAINSVVVNPSFRGQGIAGKIVEHAVNYAKQNNLLVKPICSFAVAEFTKKQEYKDIEYK